MTKDDLPPLPEPMYVHYENTLDADDPNAVRVFGVDDMQAYALAAIAAHDAKREKVLLMREPYLKFWTESIFQNSKDRSPMNEYRWAYIEREGA